MLKHGVRVLPAKLLLVVGQGMLLLLAGHQLLHLVTQLLWAMELGGAPGKGPASGDRDRSVEGKLLVVEMVTLFQGVARFMVMEASEAAEGRGGTSGGGRLAILLN